MCAAIGACTAYLSGAPVFTPVFSGVLVTRSLLLCVMFCRSLFVRFPLVIVLSVLRFKDFYYPVVIFKLLWYYREARHGSINYIWPQKTFYRDYLRLCFPYHRLSNMSDGWEGEGRKILRNRQTLITSNKICYLGSAVYCLKYESNIIICTILSEWLLFNANSAIFQPYYGDNRLIFNAMMRSALY